MCFLSGTIEYFSKVARKSCRKVCCQHLTGMDKQVTQEDYSYIGTKSVLLKREQYKMARTPLVDLFKISIVKKIEDERE